MEKYEILKFKDGEFELDVNVSPEEDTVWLTKEEIATLFEKDRSVISRHINNIFKEKELLEIATRAKFAQVRIEGGREVEREMDYYNLDVVLCVGYRVNGKRGILFRQWANYVLNQHIFKKQDLLLQHSEYIIDLQNKVTTLEKNQAHPLLFQKGEQLEGYISIKRFLKTARQSIFIIDDYFDHSFDDVLKEIAVTTTIFTDSDNIVESNDIYEVHKSKKCHDRFIFVDGVGYQLGCSLKDIGNSLSLVTKLNSITLSDILKIIK